MIDLLRKLGLNKYETEAYLNLISMGSSSAYNLSIKSNVPFGRIYDSLKVLEQKGLVEVIPSKPKKYKAVEPKTALNGLIDDEANKLDQLRADVNEAFKKLSKAASSSELVSVTTGKTNFAKKVAEHFNYKKDYWATSEGLKLDEWYPSIRRKYSEKGLKAKDRFILVDAGRADPKKLKDVKKSGVNLRDFSLPGIRLLVSDDELVTISIQDPEHEWVNIHAKNKILGKAFMKILRTLWDNAKEIK